MVKTLTKLVDSQYDIQNIDDIVRFRNDIKLFKDKNWNVLEPFYSHGEQKLYLKNDSKGIDYCHFLPKKGEAARNERRNVGVYSTVLCLEAIVNYKNEVNCKKLTFDSDTCSSLFKFIVRGVTHRLYENDCSTKECKNEPVIQPSLVSKINITSRLFSFFQKYIAEDQKLKNNLEILGEIAQLNTSLLYITLSVEKAISDSLETLHPYIFYKFIKLVEKWEYLLKDIIDTAHRTIDADKGNFSLFLSKEENKVETRDIDITNNSPDVSYWDITPDQTKRILNRIIKNLPKYKNSLKKYYLDRTYLLAKYELYRQIALNHSGDMTLFDVKRLIYSLLVVTVDDQFSNYLVRDNALNLIFKNQKEHRHSMWPTGQLLYVSKDSSESITAVECACDLLEFESKEHYVNSIRKFLPEIKAIFHNVLRSAQIDKSEAKIAGWYSLSQRDKTPTSWTSALTLLFLKRFCNLLSLEIKKRSENFFAQNYRETEIDWSKIYDCTAVKSKLCLMFPRDIYGNVALDPPTTAMFFGPPGTGKTTIARALATKLNYKYLELTPGDFYAAGESEILPKINEIFAHLQHLEETVVFIDEIDDLVITRNKATYDPRTLYVNTLLPRFQDIHDKGKIILIASTNHIERVDKAISRLGRFDLIVPVGSLSIHGRMDFLFKEFFKRFFLDYLERKKTNFTTRLPFGIFFEELILLSMSFTYTQMKIFNKELINGFKQLNPLTKMDISQGITNIKESIKFETETNSFDCDEHSRKIKFKIREEGKDEIVHHVSVRPFSVNDFDDCFSFKRNCNNEKLDLTDLIKLYLVINDLNYGENYYNIFFDENELRVVNIASKIINKFAKSTKKERSNENDSYFYNYITPFFDALCQLEVTGHKNSLRREIQKISNIVYNRPLC